MKVTMKSLYMKFGQRKIILSKKKNYKEQFQKQFE